MEKNTRLYLVKSLAPWMMEELICFSELCKFKIIFFRKVPAFYEKDIEVLKNNKIEIVFQPFSIFPDWKNLFYSIKFIFKNLTKFFDSENGLFTIQAAIWFLWLKKNLLDGTQSIHAQFSAQSAIVAYLIKKKYGIEYSFTFHAYDIYGNNKWFKTLSDNARAAISISEFNINYVVKKYGASLEKLKLSRLGVRIPSVVEPGKNNDKIIIGFMSHLEKKKGIPYLMEAFKEIHIRYPDKFELLIAGDGDEMEFIISFISNNDLTKNVKLLNKIRDKGKTDFYSAIDFFVLPSITIPNDMDGIPVVLMEAISYGKPVISTNVSGIPEICVNNYDGLLIQEKNTKELIEAIEKLAFDLAFRDKLAANSLQFAISEYDLVKNSHNKLKQIKWL